MIATYLLAGLLFATPPGEHPPSRELLIVAPRALSEAATAYAKADRPGLVSRVVVLEDAIQGRVGRDDAERFKHFLFEEWTAHREILRYVLLVGDVDVMPVRYMVLDRVTAPAFDYAFYPSDLYYADLAKPDGSFDDWNAAKEGFHADYYGEVRGEKNKTDPMHYDGIDYRPEIGVGRWPASTPAQVSAIAAKSLAFEKWAMDPESRHAALAAVGGWIENRPAMDAVNATLNPGWKTDRLYWKDAGRDDGTPPPDAANVLRAINAGAGVVLHSGHGSDTSWAESISVGSIAGMTNTHKPVVCMSAGCSTARIAVLGPYEPYIDLRGVEHTGTNFGEVFTQPPPAPACYQTGKFNLSGLGEELVRAPEKGAAAYIGCVTGSQPCGMTLLAGFAEGLADPASNPRLGDCWMHAVSRYYDAEHLATLTPTPDWYPASIFFQGMKFVVLGDPSLRVPGGQ